MYTLSRRAKTSLIVPVLFLVILVFNMLTRQVASQSTNSVTNQAIILLLTKLSLIYIVSLIFLSIETVIKIFITDKESPQSVIAAQKIKNASLQNKIAVINSIELSEGTNKITHSVLFQIMMIVLAFFASTNSTSLLGRGVTLSILMQIFVDQAMLLKQKRDLSSWFWQIKATYPLQFHQVYFSVMCALFALTIYSSIR